jgi:hypothetical protein
MPSRLFWASSRVLSNRAQVASLRTVFNPEYLMLWYLAGMENERGIP